LLGERTGQRYRLGDRVQVRVVKVDMESTKVDFVLDELIQPSKHGMAEDGPTTGKKPASSKALKGKTKDKKRHG
jgi:ribonuclease R